MTCEKAKRLIDAAFDGALHEDAYRDVCAHLGMHLDMHTLEDVDFSDIDCSDPKTIVSGEGCPSCRAYAAQLRTLKCALADWEPERLPEGFESRLHDGLMAARTDVPDASLNPQTAESPEKPSRWRMLVNRPWKRYSLALAGAAVLLIGVYIAPHYFGDLANDYAARAGHGVGYLSDTFESTPHETTETALFVPESGSDSDFGATLKEAPMEAKKADETAPTEAAAGKAIGTAPEAAQRSDFREGRLMIKTASLNMEVEGYADVEASVKALVSEAGGYIENASTQFLEDPSRTEKPLKTGRMQIRIPEGAHEKVFGDIKALGRVMYENMSASDVTTAYRDTASEVQNLRITEDRLRNILKDATIMADILDIERELTRIRGDIEQKTQQLGHWEALVDMTTIELHLVEVRALKPSVEPIDAGLLDRAGEALIHTLNGIRGGFEAVVIGIIALSPFWIPLGALIALGIWKFKRRKRT